MQDHRFECSFLSVDCTKLAGVYQDENNWTHTLVVFDILTKDQKIYKNYQAKAMSPDLAYTFSNENHSWMLNDLHNDVRHVISSLEEHNAKQKRFFTPCSKFVGIETADEY